MYSVELYNRVRRACHVDGMSRREAARFFGIDRSLRDEETVRGTVSPENGFEDFAALSAARISAHQGACAPEAGPLHSNH